MQTKRRKVKVWFCCCLFCCCFPLVAEGAKIVCKFLEVDIVQRLLRNTEGDALFRVVSQQAVRVRGEINQNPVVHQRPRRLSGMGCRRCRWLSTPETEFPKLFDFFVCHFGETSRGISRDGDPCTSVGQNAVLDGGIEAHRCIVCIENLAFQRNPPAIVLKHSFRIGYIGILRSSVQSLPP